MESWSSYLKWNLAQLVHTYKLFPAWLDQNCFTNLLEVRARERFWQEHWTSTTTIQWSKVTLFLPNTLLELLIAVLMEPRFPRIPEQTWDSWAKNRWKVNTCWGTCNKPHCKSRPQIWARSLNLPGDKWHNFLRALLHTCARSSHDWLWKL
jgi:hypothetical protein